MQLMRRGPVARQQVDQAPLPKVVLAHVKGQLRHAIVIGVPMYNFSVPSQLKAWLDRIAQPGRTFRYTPEGPVGLAGGRRVIVASTRGGMYSVGAASGMDFQESYLKAFFGFLGITDVQFVRAERLTKGAEAREQSIAEVTALVPGVLAHALAA